VSRTTQLLKALSIGYGFQVLAAVTGLLLTPFLLNHLGTEPYGRWLVVLQVLTILGLLDFGVVAVLPREVARASGSDGRELVSRTLTRAYWLVVLQLPLIATIGFAVWFLVASHRPELSVPLGIILLAFVVRFPLRVPGAALSGLQDATFNGLLQLVAWFITTVVSVAMVLAGKGLVALAVAWGCGQIVSCVVAWWRLNTRFPETRESRAWPGWKELTHQVGPSFWNTLQQLAQFLLSGSELIVLDWTLGPVAVVVYSCTVRLISLLNNQPYALAISAGPAIAQLQGSGDRERLWRACRALSLGTVMASGLMAIVILATNGAFVPAWVGVDKYAGAAVVLAAVVLMVARHTVFTFTHVVFALGYDSRVAFAAIADGVLTVGATYAWVSAVGILGVPLGSLTSLIFTNGLVSVLTVAAAEGGSPLGVVRWMVPWLVRFLVVAVPLAGFAVSSASSNPFAAAIALIAGVGLYLALNLSLLSREPLKGYKQRIVNTLRRKIGLPAKV
jgi:O-antigen/teichoic acid export membrane protein